MNQFAIISTHYIPKYYNEYFDFYEFSSINKIFTEIKRKELNENFLYRGLLIINDPKLIVNEEIILGLINLDLNENILYTNLLKHDLNNPIINENFLFCNSFIFSIISNYNRIQTSLYGQCFNHRIKIKQINRT